MVINMPSGLELATATRTGMGFFALFRLFLLIAVFGMIFVNFFIIAVGQKDVPGGLKYLGDNFLSTTQKLQDESLKLINRGTAISAAESQLKSIWLFITNIWALISAVFIIYVWLWMLSSILLFFPIADKSKTFTAWVFAIIIFLLLQMTIAKSFSAPLQAFKIFGYAIYSLFAPVTDRMINYGQNITNLTKDINNYTNLTYK